MHRRLIGHQGRPRYPAESESRLVGFENTQINDARSNNQPAGVNMFGCLCCCTNRGNFAVRNMQRQWLCRICTGEDDIAI